MKSHPLQKKQAGAGMDQPRHENEGMSKNPPPFQLKAGNVEAPVTAQTSHSGGLPGEMVDGFATSTGHDLSDVAVHRNSAKPTEVGALAFAQGNEIHLAAGQEQHLAHEAAHVVQQREGRVQANTQVGGMPVNDSEALESEADAMGAKAMAMTEEGAVGQRKSAKGGAMQRKRPNSSVKQLYKEYPIAGESDPKTGTHWAANSAKLRVSEDGTAAIAQHRVSGSKEMYVDPSRLPGINADLKKAKAPMEFVEKGGGKVEGAAPGNLSGPKKTLSEVMPVEPADHLKTKEIPDDCGNAARTVTGTFAEGKTLKAKYNDASGNAKNTGGLDPELMKYEIMVDHFAASIPDAAQKLADITTKFIAKNALYDKLKPFFARFEKITEALNKLREDFAARFQTVAAAIAGLNTEKAAIPANDPKKADKEAAIDQKIKTLLEDFEAYRKSTMLKDAAHRELWNKILAEKVDTKTVKEVMDEFFATVKEYEALKAVIMKPYGDQSEKEKADFDKKVGLNRYANPEVGGAYTISSGGNNYPNKSTWNFHWGGVVFKSTTGSDNITMENYAGNANSEWRLQMYGIPTVGNDRTGQTFHEQHEATKQHGDAPTTMTTEKK